MPVSIVNPPVASSGGGAQGTPTFIDAADTFTIPIHTQVLYNITIDAEGVIDGDGVLVEV